ncbi:MAG: 50S ribosomal protein L29 [Christensenellaceae bacterium]|jgi:large subunit ribosomal protein L29|nr:50S ribosomal protein L29 [Christensenellaceae bacterium]
MKNIYKEMTLDELKKAFKDKKQELFNLRFQHTIGQLKNTMQLRMVKRDIARILTELKTKEVK